MREILQFIARRSLGHRISATNSYAVIKARIKAIVRRLLNDLNVRTILNDDGVRSTREINAREYVIDCLQYWYPRLTERRDKAGRLLYSAIGMCYEGEGVLRSR